MERLLARGYLSGAEYDRIATNVLDRVAPVRDRRRGRWLVAGVPVLAAAAGLAFHLGTPDVSVDAGDGFAPKGQPYASIDGSVELACSGHGRPCRVGDTLMFLVDSSVASGYLTAKATRIEPPSDERHVLFPSVDGESPYVTPGSGTVVVPQGIRWGPQQGPGLFRVEISFVERRVEPTSLQGPALTTSVDLTVVE